MWLSSSLLPTGKYRLKVINNTTKLPCWKICVICLKLTITILERHQLMSQCLYCYSEQIWHKPANIYLFKLNSINTRKWCEICSKLASQKRRSGVFIVNFEHASHLFLVFLLLLWIDECLLGRFRTSTQSFYFEIQIICLLGWLWQTQQIHTCSKSLKKNG